MQMLVMAPIATSEAGFAAGFAPYSVADSTQWAWPAEGSWLQASTQAPHQFPMEIPYNPELSTDFNHVSPAQFHMEITTGSSLAAEQPTASTLRRRHLHTGVTPPLQMHSSWQHDEESRVNSDTHSEAEFDSFVIRMADELLRQVDAGAEEQWSALARFQQLAFSSKISSRAAQHVIENAPAHQSMLLVSSLRGHVCRATQSKHANFVVQKIIEVMPMARAGFIVEELTGFAHETACHPFGCRVLCRLLEHLSPGDTATLELLEEVLVDVEWLCSHAFGSYVVRHILEFGLEEHKHRVAIAILPNVTWYAKHRLASHVVEAALRSCALEDQRVIAEALLAYQQVSVLATNRFGHHVVQALLALPQPAKQQAEHALRQVEQQLKHSKLGNRILQLLPPHTAQGRL